MAQTITKRIDFLKRWEKELVELRKKEQAVANGISKEWDAVCASIRVGKESTGGVVKDFVIARYGRENTEYEQIYRELEARLAGKVGQFVLLVEAKEHRIGFRKHAIMPPIRDDDFYRVLEHTYLGILSGESLIINIADNQCAIPVGDRIAYHVSELLSKEGCSFMGGVFLMVSSGDGERDLVLHLNKELRSRLSGKTYRELEICVGDDEVIAWFSKHRMRYMDILLTMATMVGRPLTEQMKTGNPFLGISLR